MRLRKRHSRIDMDLNVDCGLEDDFSDFDPLDGAYDELGDDDIEAEYNDNEVLHSFGEYPDEDNIEEDIVSKEDVTVGNDRITIGVTSKERSEQCILEHLENVESHKSIDPMVIVDVEQQNVNLLTIEIEKRLMVGSPVHDLEQAYLIYCEYGRCKGFGVRKGEQRYFGKTDILKWKEFVCSCNGVNDKHTGKVANYKKLLLRTGCKAKIRIARIMNQPWRVKIFETEHNHGLVPSDQTYMLRSSRNLSYAKQSILEALTSAGIGVSGACGFMERECGDPQNLGDHLSSKKRKTKLANNDAISLLEYFSKKTNEDPFFYWKVQLDDDHRIMNFFFRDARCAEDYRAFGDVLSVDTTHRTNCYNLICMPFVGMNHHALNVLFGIGFLSDETSSTFEWLFGAFLESMSGVEPKVVFTDQCRAMMNALDKIFPHAAHRLCQWRINRNAAEKFGSLNGNFAFKKLWYKCTNDVETELEFDEVWKQMSDNKDLKCRNWFNGMYAIRHRWAFVFTRDLFTAGMLATSRSEATNRVLKLLHRSSSTLYEFVMNYEEVQSRWRRKEREQDTLDIWDLDNKLVSDNDLFCQAASVYTRTIYKWFEHEATKALGIIVSHDMDDIGDGNLSISVKTLKGGRCRKVIYNKDTHHTTCSCRMLESEGIFCRHIIKVYYFMNVFHIPEGQILKRWTKRARDAFRVDICGLEVRSRLPGMLFLNTALRQLYDLASPCMDDEDACLHILKQLEILGRELPDMLRMPKPKAKRKVLGNLNSNAFTGLSVKDPKHNLDIFFSNSRSLGEAENTTENGRRKKMKNPSSTPLSFVPPNYIPDHPSTAPPEVNIDPFHGSKIYVNTMLGNNSQPW